MSTIDTKSTMAIPHNFSTFVEMIVDRSPLQKKKISSFFLERDNEYFLEPEEFSIQYIDYLKSQDIPLSSAVEYYLKMCSDMVKSQLFFMRTGKYPCEKAGEAYKEVYGNETEMKSYMIGLALSQFLWPTHYRIYSFLKNYIQKHHNTIHKYLEIGPGHGLFLKTTIDLTNKERSCFTVVDISKTSIDITKSIIDHHYRDRLLKIEYHNVDML
jgi:hypothetical protein